MLHSESVGGRGISHRICKDQGFGGTPVWPTSLRGTRSFDVFLVDKYQTTLTLKSLKRGRFSVSGNSAPILCPHPPNPREVGAVIVSVKLWLQRARKELSFRTIIAEARPRPASAFILAVSSLAADRRPGRTTEAISAIQKSWKSSPRDGSSLYRVVGNVFSLESVVVSLIFAAIVHRVGLFDSPGRREVARDYFLPANVTSIAYPIAAPAA